MHYKNTNKVKMDPQHVRVAVLGLTADRYVRLQLSEGQSSVIQCCCSSHPGWKVAPQNCYLQKGRGENTAWES